MNDRKDGKDDIYQGQDDGRGGDRRSGRAKFFRKKVCRFCANHSVVNYKDVDILGRYVTERGKILPARITGVCARHQRAVSVGIKRARHLAFLPFVVD